MSDLHIHVHPDPALLAAFLNLKDEVTMKLSEITAGLQTMGATLANVDTGVKKIGTETQGLQQKITDLETVIQSMGDDAPAELVEAFNAAKAQASTVAASVNAVDLMVPDATAG